MYPLDIQEFATAVGVSNDVIGHLHECFEQQKAVDEYIHQRMLELVRLYLIVGGMPAAVQRYLDTNNLRRVLSEQRDIIRTYKRDITKYDSKRKLQNEEYAVPHAFVLCLDNVQVNGKVAYLPIYMLMFMHQSKVEDVIYRFQP